MTNTEATVIAAILSAHTVIIVALAVALGRTREQLARCEAQVQDLWRHHNGGGSRVRTVPD